MPRSAKPRKGFRVVEGELVDYNSKSLGAWVPARIHAVDPDTGCCELDIKRGTWIPKEAQKHLFRARTMPTLEQKDLLRALINEGKAEHWCACMFKRHAAVDPSFTRMLLSKAGYAACGDDVERELGICGLHAALVLHGIKLGKTSLTASEFNHVVWEILSNAVTEYTEKVEKDYILQQSPSGNITQHYDFVKVLGSGAFGEVKLATQKVTGIRRAIKSVKKEADEASLREMELEVKMLKVLDHPYIVKLYEHYDDDRCIYLVMDFCSGGDLCQVIQTHAKTHATRFEDCFVADVMRQLLTAIHHMHSHSILHLDLKCNNIMLTPSKDTIAPSENNLTMRHQSVLVRPHCMVIDLGVAKFFRAGNREYVHPAGTPMTMAPEVWKGEMHPQADIFSLGTVMFCLGAFDYPFKGFPLSAHRRAMIEYYGKQPKVDWSLLKLSREGMQLCKSMLQLQREIRPATAQECLEHDFITLNRLVPSSAQGRDWIHDEDLPDDIIRRLRAAPKRTVLYKSVAVSVARLWPANQMPLIKDSFLQLDRKGEVQNGRLQKSVIRDELIKRGVDATEATKCAEAMDFNKDGVIDWTEWVATCIPLGDLEKELHTIFKSADADQDGLLSGEDLSRMLAMDNNSGRMLSEILVDLVQREGPEVRVDWHDFRHHFESKKDIGCHPIAEREDPATSEADDKVEEDPLWSHLMNCPPAQFENDATTASGFLSQARGLVDRARVNVLEVVGAIEPGAAQPWRANMSKLRGMGFKDAGTCRDALVRHNNIINHRLIEELQQQHHGRMT